MVNYIYIVFYKTLRNHLIYLDKAVKYPKITQNWILLAFWLILIAMPNFDKVIQYHRNLDEVSIVFYMTFRSMWIGTLSWWSSELLTNGDDEYFHCCLRSVLSSYIHHLNLALDRIWNVNGNPKLTIKICVWRSILLL